MLRSRLLQKCYHEVYQRSGALSAGKEFYVLWEISFCKRILFHLISEQHFYYQFLISSFCIKTGKVN